MEKKILHIFMLSPPSWFAWRAHVLTRKMIIKKEPSAFPSTPTNVEERWRSSLRRCRRVGERRHGGKCPILPRRDDANDITIKRTVNNGPNRRLLSADNDDRDETTTTTTLFSWMQKCVICWVGHFACEGCVRLKECAKQKMISVSFAPHLTSVVLPSGR